MPRDVPPDTGTHDLDPHGTARRDAELRRSVDSHEGHDQLARRVQTARDHAVDWIASSANAERVARYLNAAGTAPGHSIPTRNRTLEDYTALLTARGVPGIEAPGDLGETHAARWSRSVTIAVLRQLRKTGHLRWPDATAPNPRPTAHPLARGLGDGTHDHGENPSPVAPSR